MISVDESAGDGDAEDTGEVGTGDELPSFTVVLPVTLSINMRATSSEMAQLLAEQLFQAPQSLFLGAQLVDVMLLKAQCIS